MFPSLTLVFFTAASLALSAGDENGSEQNLSGAETLRMLGLGLQNVKKPDEGRTQDVQQGSVQVTKYTRCELAEALRQADVPEEKIPTWVCLANSMNGMDISTVKGDDEGHYYGLFQVSDQWWCDVGPRRGCGIPCSVIRQSLDANIQCAKMVYAETRIQKGDGFVAWEGRHLNRCRNASADSYC